MRDALKNLIHRTLVELGAASLARSRFSNFGVILAYHNIVPDGEPVDGELPLHLSQAEFGRQLDVLSETHEIIALQELLDSGRSDRPRAAITFDDCYRGAVTAGVAELLARNLPATFFVSPGLLNDTTFWWDAIAAGGSGLVPDEIRDYGLTRLAGCQSRVLRWAEQEGVGFATVAPHCRSATVEEVRNAEKEPGITVGSHTWSHPNLSRISEQDVEREVRRSTDWLRSELDSVIPWLAYPYGFEPSMLTTDDEVVEYGLTTRAGMIDLEQAEYEPRSLPRINIPSGVGIARFELLASGI